MNVNEILFHQPDCAYSEKTPGYVNIGTKERIAVIQSGSAYSRKAMLYCHGNAEDIHDSTVALQKLGFIPPDVFFAAVAYPGYGLSDGEQSEEGCYRNAHRLYEWLSCKMGFAPENILVVGYSLGTGVALELAGTCPVGAVLLQAPFLSGRRLIGFWHPGLEKALPPEVEPFPSLRRIGEVRCPVAVIHGTADEVVPFEQGEKLYAVAPVKAGFTAVASAGHCNILATLGAFRYKEIVASLL